ncbi:MAG: MBL fold metallo-hydrolase [Firmicutes bacterium]|nr:MBL fold metallo-hydrolase [Bacillota bacterium]
MVEQVLVHGSIDEFCYFYIDDDTRHGYLIDPGAEPEKLLGLIRDRGWTIEAILLTHGHFDHFGAAADIRRTYGIHMFAHEKSGAYLTDPRINLSAYMSEPLTAEDVTFVKDGDVIEHPGAPSIHLKVIHTPGHTLDGVLFYDEKAGLAFSGDTIFKGNIGNYRFPGGNYETLIHSIVNRILTLPDDTVLYSGHSEPTTVGAERGWFL